MKRHERPLEPDDPLLQRYHEANALDTARPAPSLRENVLAHARAMAASRQTAAVVPATPPAANDRAWRQRAFGTLAVVGLIGLLVLQFDRGSPDEQDTALGTRLPRPEAQVAAPPAPATTRSAEPPVPPAPPAVAPDNKRTRAATPTRPSAEAVPAPEAPVNEMAQPPAPAASPAPVVAAPAARLPSVARSATPDTLKEQHAATAARPMVTTPPLFSAIAAQDTATVQHWLSEGADPNQRDGDGRTPLMAAAMRGHADIVRLLLAAGADRHLRDRQGLSAADHAERAGHAALLPVLQ